MASLLAPAAITPPPVPPGIDPNLNNYLQQFSLWASKGFAATINSNQGAPGVLLSANDAAAGVSPATYQLGVDSAGDLETRLMASGSGAPGLWQAVYSKMGVTDGSNAAAGEIGEYILAPASGSLTSGVATNLGATTLTPGDWSFEGTIQFIFSTNVGAAAVVGVSTTSATLPPQGQGGRAQLNINPPAISVVAIASGSTRVNISTPGFVYLVGFANFATGTCTTSGSLRGRRMR